MRVSVSPDARVNSEGDNPEIIGAGASSYSLQAWKVNSIASIGAKSIDIFFIFGNLFC
ncbi:hypothetical protein QYS49_12015 [Marivirga salinae]|uniref:Uncharacterized protein n=1 Tax=Marivirga salinarum TaxID=3059078 RepID=A0AA49GCP3_9BACT|nr:hypothetical protein [Marivirga sp. BDSF4-3]WKK77745.2 hypothetical protein QYS49_12015 [Marivirga sp. BDSF4-3]